MQIRTKLPAVKPLARINYEDHLSQTPPYNPLTQFCKQNELTKLSEDQ